MTQDRRGAPRCGIVAPAEVWEKDHTMRLVARASDISLNGCYLDMHGALALGSEVTVRINYQESYFESPATVAYSHRNLGMGVKFHDIKPEALDLLKHWLENASPTQRWAI